jgi:hypothetical protein
LYVFAFAFCDILTIFSYNVESASLTAHTTISVGDYGIPSSSTLESECLLKLIL